MEAMYAPVYFAKYDIHGDMMRVSLEVIESIKKNKVYLKEGLLTLHENVDIVVIRENTEGDYMGLEHEVVPGVVKSLKFVLEMKLSN
ncbi:hypothetical protein SADUNF_Sadunf07G0056600 [Salix dunnii]|uniref:Isopropylmalate dehydrogenase-like domain-containing protein n=1 Tax=Salix dunnii TaxID=1413687 RepID=A0A835JZW1_9ROSI|nr:hypothetical protein SADUNF_Sadunf07G0056600 [Salix dunnii]